MLNPTDLKNGATFSHNGETFKVLDYAHIKMARGGATIKIKARNMLTGSIKELSFTSGDKINEANVENKNLQYLYSDSENLFFMNMEDYTNVELPKELVEDELKYLVEGKEFMVVFLSGKPVSLTIPPSMFYKVIEAPPAVKGNTATSASKKITLENGLVIDAPQFIKVGEVVKVNTTSGQYTGRGK